MPEYMLDCSWARHGWPAVKAAGFSTVSLYLSNDPSKNCKPKDVADLFAAGLTLLLNWESTAGRPLQGNGAGVQDGQRANAQADALGYPKTAAIYYSCDTDPGQVVNQAIIEYYRGLAGSGRPIGVYGGAGLVKQLLAAGLVKFGWVANATSWDHGVSNAGAHLQQHYHTRNQLSTPAGWGLNDYDENLILQSNFGQWGAHEVQKVPKEDILYIIRRKSDGAESVTNGETKRHIASPDDAAFLVWIAGANGIKLTTVDCDDEQYASIPDLVNEAGASGGVAKIDYAKIAKVVNDDAAARLVK